MGLCRRTEEDWQSPEAIRAASERLEGLTAYLLAQHAAARDRLYRPVATKAGPPHSMRQQRRTSQLDRIPAAISRHQQRQAVLSDEEELGAVTSLLEMKSGRLVGYQAGRSRPSSPKRLRRRAASDALELRRTSSSLSGGSAFHLVTSSTDEEWLPPQGMAKQPAARVWANWSPALADGPAMSLQIHQDALASTIWQMATPAAVPSARTSPETPQSLTPRSVLEMARREGWSIGPTPGHTPQPSRPPSPIAAELSRHIFAALPAREALPLASLDAMTVRDALDKQTPPLHVCGAAVRFPGHVRHRSWDGTFDTAVQLSGIAGRPALSITPDSMAGIWSDAFKEGTQPLLAAPITPPKTFSIAAKPSEGPQRKGGKKNSSAAGLHRSVSDAGPCAAKLQTQRCNNCGVTSTPAWRRFGTTLLCNACGLRRSRGSRM